MRKFIENFLIFLIGGSIYYLIETIYKEIFHSCGSHWTMFLLGGILTLLIGLLNESVFTWNTPLFLQSFIGGIITTLGEFATGYIVNIKLHWNVWDYSDLPGNIMGQICPTFFFIWCLLSVVAILFDDWFRYRVFKEEKPKYIFF